MHCALRRAMHAGRRALSTTAPATQSRSWVLGVASAAAGAAGALAVAGERPPPSVAEWAARDDPGSSNAEQRFAQWKRVDEQLVASGAAKSNAIYDALGAQTDALKHHRLWSKPDGSEVACVATFGTDCVGHPGVVHGGVTSLLFDNTLGWANALSITKGGDPSQHDTVKQFGMTANLSVNYRRPLFVGQTVVISCSLDRVEGRKRFLKGVMKDGKTGGVIADATALYVVPRTAAEKAAGVKSTWAK
jgi:acyl-coenzyme A thioesterase PaaI-like protein